MSYYHAAVLLAIAILSSVAWWYLRKPKYVHYVDPHHVAINMHALGTSCDKSCDKSCDVGVQTAHQPEKASFPKWSLQEAWVDPRHFDVEIYPGDNVQDAVNRCPVDGFLMFHPGTYSMVHDEPNKYSKSGDLNGGSILLLRNIHMFGRGQATINYRIDVHKVLDASFNGLTIRPCPNFSTAIYSMAAMLRITGCVLEARYGVSVRSGNYAISYNHMITKCNAVLVVEDSSVGVITHNQITCSNTDADYRFCEKGIIVSSGITASAQIEDNVITGFERGICVNSGFELQALDANNSFSRVTQCVVDHPHCY